MEDSDQGPSFDWAPQQPSLEVRPDPMNVLFDPTALDRVPTDAVDLSGKNRGTERLDFTSSRLIPVSADQQWPYLTVGVLFFNTPLGDFTCSAAVIAKRVILTAGQCVHSGEASGFYDDFLFVPAYRSGVAPFGVWDWHWVFTTSNWVNGRGRLPARDDFAMIVLRDRAGDRIGDVTGSLGFKTNRLRPNHVTILGYAGNLDNGQWMHQVHAGTSKRSSNNTVLYGSDMSAGSGGAPWIQNFGARASGQNGGLNANTNRVVGVTSFGPTGTAPKYQGSSTPGATFSRLFRDACDQASDNC
jgi:V8-like Glu-specific endopeptidase